MHNKTTIQLDKTTVHALKDLREYPRQTYNDLLKRMVTVFTALRQRNQYDEFLHKVQQAKMKELWDNPEDEAWEDV